LTVKEKLGNTLLGFYKGSAGALKNIVGRELFEKEKNAFGNAFIIYDKK